MGVDFLDVVLDSAGAHPLGIHGKDEFLEAADIILALLDDSRRKFGFPVPGTYRDSMPWWPEPVTPPKGSPNIVFVVLDDVGFSDLGCYGSEIATPHIDALAGSGLHYSNFHVTAMCSPTRACLLTGRNAHAVGMGAIAEWSCGFPGYEGKITHRAATLAEILKGAGVGKWHLAPLEAMNAAGPMDQWPRGVGSNAGSVFMVP